MRSHKPATYEKLAICRRKKAAPMRKPVPVPETVGTDFKIFLVAGAGHVN